MNRIKSILLVIATLACASIVALVFVVARARAQAIATEEVMRSQARQAELLAATSAEATPPLTLAPEPVPGTAPGPLNQAAATFDQHVSPTGAALVCHAGDEVQFVIFTRQGAAHFDVTASGRNQGPGREYGWIKFPSGHTVEFHHGFSPSKMETLGLGGHDFELQGGRVFFVGEDGAAAQMHVFPRADAAGNVDALAGLEVENGISMAIQKLQGEYSELLRTNPASDEAKRVADSIAACQNQLAEAARRTSAAMHGGSTPPPAGLPGAGGPEAFGSSLPPAAPLEGTTEAPVGVIGAAAPAAPTPLPVGAPPAVGGAAPAPGFFGGFGGAGVGAPSMPGTNQGGGGAPLMPGMTSAGGAPSTGFFSGFSPATGAPVRNNANFATTGQPTGNATPQSAAQMLRESELKVMRRHYENVVQRVLEAEEKVHVATTDSTGNAKAQPDPDAAAQQERVEVLQRYAKQLENEIVAKAAESADGGAPGAGMSPGGMGGMSAMSTPATMPGRAGGGSGGMFPNGGDANSLLPTPAIPGLPGGTDRWNGRTGPGFGSGEGPVTPEKIVVLTAQVDAKRAALASEQVALDEAHDQLPRVKSAYAQKAVSEEEMSKAQFAVKKAAARVAQAEAELRTAEAELAENKSRLDKTSSATRPPVAEPGTPGVSPRNSAISPAGGPAPANGELRRESAWARVQAQCAALDVEEVTREEARTRWKRLQELYDKGAVSDEDLSQAESTVRKSEARIRQLKVEIAATKAGMAADGVPSDNSDQTPRIPPAIGAGAPPAPVPTTPAAPAPPATEPPAVPNPEILPTPVPPPVVPPSPTVPAAPPATPSVR